MNRVTVIVPAALIDAANHVHVLLGKSKGFNTYGEPQWQDAQGNLYAVSSGLWSDAQIAGVTNPDVLRQIEPPEGVDMALAAQAQASFELRQVAEGGDPLPSPMKGGILALAGPRSVDLLAEIGIFRVKEALGADILPHDLSEAQHG